MPLNPLDWTAEPFLTLFASLIVADLVAVILLRRAIASGGAATAGGDLDPVELAYLRGGPVTAADTVLLSFLVAGAATIDAKTSRVNIGSASGALPPNAEFYRACVSGPVTRDRFQSLMVRRLDGVGTRLVSRGLMIDPSRVSSYRRSATLLLVLLLGFGAAKVMVGLSRGKPVGLLLVFIVVAAVLHYLLAFRGQFRSRAGTALLDEVRARRARAARAPLPDELTFAFALTGAAVLVGTPYAPFRMFVQPQPGGDGGSGGGSGCGNGGGGGDGGGVGDGGGGGCGGCSG